MAISPNITEPTNSLSQDFQVKSNLNNNPRIFTFKQAFILLLTTVKSIFLS